MTRNPKLIFGSEKVQKQSIEPLEKPTSGYAIDMSDSTKYRDSLRGSMSRDRSYMNYTFLFAKNYAIFVQKTSPIVFG